MQAINEIRRESGLRALQFRTCMDGGQQLFLCMVLNHVSMAIKMESREEVLLVFFFCVCVCASEVAHLKKKKKSGRSATDFGIGNNVA